MEKLAVILSCSKVVSGVCDVKNNSFLCFKEAVLIMHSYALIDKGEAFVFFVLKKRDKKYLDIMLIHQYIFNSKKLS